MDLMSWLRTAFRYECFKGIMYLCRMKNRLFCTVFAVNLLFALLPKVFAQTDTVQRSEANRINAGNQQEKPYLILISADGFRYDYADKFESHNLRGLREQGVSAEWMVPSFPSLTFPNHYS